MKREKSALKNNLRQLLNCQGVAGLQCRCLLGQFWKRFVIHSCQTSPGCGALEADAWQLRGAPCKSLCWEDFCSLCLKLVWILETVSSTATCLSTSQVFLSDYQKKEIFLEGRNWGLSSHMRTNFAEGRMEEHPFVIKWPHYPVVVPSRDTLSYWCFAWHQMRETYGNTANYYIIFSHQTLRFGRIFIFGLAER